MPEPAHGVRGARIRPRNWLLRAALRNLAETLLSFADRIVPKQPERIMIGSNAGTSFNGNAVYLLRYLRTSNRGTVRVATRSAEVKLEVEKEFPGVCLDANSWRAVWFGLTSASLCMTHSRTDLGPLKYLRGPRFVYLTHGIPLKAMGYLKAFADPTIKRSADSFQAITCSSAFEAERWREAYRLPPERTWVTGAARNDALFSPRESLRDDLGIAGTGRVVLYAPTFRETGAMDSYLPTTDVDASALVALLESFDATLLVRPHPMDADVGAAYIARLRSSRIVTADHSRVDNAQDLLPLVDILVTDYSSIYLDFLLLDRPIIFDCHDLERYTRDRGLLLDYGRHTPGQHVRDGASFLEALRIELEGQDPEAVARGSIRSLFHAHHDDRSSERIADHLLEQRPH